MRYSIGDVSRVMGMTTSALHFYEKEGIIDTPKVESGHRYYEEADVNRLISAKKYRSMGVPVRDIAQQFSTDGMSGEQVLARVRKHRDEALRLERKYAALAQDIDQIVRRSEEALSSVGVVDIRRAEDMLVFKSSSGGRIPKDKTEQSVLKRWLEAMPAVSVSICREENADAAKPCLMISKQRAEVYGLQEESRTVGFVQGSMALHAIVVVCGDELYVSPDAIFAPILAFAQEHRFVQKGTMWGNQLFVDCSGGILKHYYETYMCFE